jgi:hypothetical protein
VSNKNINIVVNLSDRPLSLIETSILNKGLNFCVTNNNPTIYSRSINKEVDKFIRNVQIKCMFVDNNEHNIEKFTGNPDWVPPKFKQNVALNGYADFLKTNIGNLVKNNKTKQNISRAERAALNKLRLDKNILIQKADKGGSIVVLNTGAYQNKIETMLSDPVTYTPTDDINLDKAKIDIVDIVNYLYERNYISKKQRNFFLRGTPKMPTLYGLPKIHKNNWPLRPIVSQIDSPAYQINKYVDYLLTTAEKSIENLLQDTTRFLQIIKTLPPVSNNVILFTIDVTSLYTVLPHNMVLDYVTELYVETLSEWCRYTPDVRPIPGDILKRIINIILNQTFFEFNNTVYTQNYGITMGAPSSVKLANITLHKHLINILNNYAGQQPNIQLRLIDDIFGIWEHTEEELLQWVAFLNSSHNSIKFTLEYSKTEIAFLDTMVYIDKNLIKTRLYKKPTDNKQYLHFNSEHPRHVKKAIPYAQALRYRRIVEDDVILNNELHNLYLNFTARLYPHEIVAEAIDKVLTLDRNELIRYKVKNTSEFNFTPFVLTFNNALVNNKECSIYKLLSDSWNILTVSAPELLHLNMPKIVFRKCQTINNILVSTLFPPKRWYTVQRPRAILNADNNVEILDAPVLKFYSHKCPNTRCLTCNFLTVNSRFYSTTFGSTFALTSNVSCNSINVVYLVTCLKCKIQYVGETGKTFRDRITAHRSCIKLKKHTPIGIHFNSLNHKVSHFSVIPIETLNNDNINARRAREHYWQLTLGTVFPKGLNAFPVNDFELFKNFEIVSALDLEVFWSLKNLEQE